MSIQGALATILENVTVELASLRSAEMLLALPTRLSAHLSLCVVTSYQDRRDFLRKRNPEITYLLDTEFNWRDRREELVIFDAYVGIEKHMAVLLDFWDGRRTVLVGPRILSLLPRAKTYILSETTYPVEVRYEASADLLTLLSSLDPTTEANIIVSSEALIDPSALPPAGSPHRVTLAPETILDLLPIAPIHMVISRPQSQGLAYVHARLVGDQPGGIAYRLYTPRYFHRLPLVREAHPTREFRALKGLQQGGRQLTAAGELVLRTDLTSRWARVITEEPQPYAALVLAVLVEASNLIQPSREIYQSRDVLMRIDEHVRTLREHFEAPTDLEVLLRIWSRYRGAGFPEPRAWALEHQLNPHVFAQAAARIHALTALLEIDDASPLKLPRATLNAVFADCLGRKVSEPHLYRDADGTLYEYETSIPLSRTKQDPPDQLLIIHTRGGTQITYALDVQTNP